MRFDIITIFPDFFTGIFGNGIVKRALANGLIHVDVHDLRNFTHDRHRTVDDRPFGGGEGMVLKPEPLVEAVESLGVATKGARGTVRIDNSALGARSEVYAGHGARVGDAGPACTHLRAL